jgi:hypothetical protein
MSMKVNRSGAGTDPAVSQRRLIHTEVMSVRVLCNQCEQPQMSALIDLKACEILEHLRMKLPNVSVEYAYLGTTHKFVISRDGLTYQVSCPERVLEANAEDQLKTMLRTIVERVLIGAAPRRIQIGAMAMSGTGLN